MTKRCDIVVACCDKLGIGFNGELPWKLTSEMQFFRKLTTTACEDKQNAVIMGRKTYFSIPEKFRPLKNRLNIVLSRDCTINLPAGVRHAQNFDSALAVASVDDSNVDNVFVIGGSTIYQEAFNSIHLHRIYLTRVYKSMQCDVFLPAAKLPHFKRVQVAGVPTALQTENDTTFEYQVYQRSESPSINISMSVAMCKANRGIAMSQKLPWPELPNDFEYYLKLTGSCTRPDALVANIKGRRTYEASGDEELSRPSVLTIVLSQSPQSVPSCPPHLVTPTMDEALRLCRENKAIERAWIMGGTEVYRAALAIPECTHCYLTEIDGDFQSDTFFPQFEHLFNLTSEGETITENGITYRFNIYERKDYSSASDSI